MAQFSLKGPTVTTSYTTDSSGKPISASKPVYSSGSTSQPQASTANNVALPSQTKTTSTNPFANISQPQYTSRPSVTQSQTQLGGLTITNPPVETNPSNSFLGKVVTSKPYQVVSSGISAAENVLFTKPMEFATSTGAGFFKSKPEPFLGIAPFSLDVGVPKTFVEATTLGATSFFPELRPTTAAASAVKLLDVRATFGEQVQFGNKIATQQSTGFIFETGSFFKPRTEVVAQSVSKGITSGNILKEVGIVRLTSEGQKAQNLARASTTIFSPTKFTTLGEFYSKTGKTLSTAPFASMGMEVGRVNELRQFNILTASEARGVPYFSTERLTQTARITEGPTTSTRYISIGAGTSGKGIELPFITRVGQEAKLSKSLVEAKDLTGLKLDLKTATQETKAIQLQNPIAQIERRAARSGMKAIQLEKGLFTASQAVVGLSKTDFKEMFSFKGLQTSAIGQAASTGFGLRTQATPGTQQLFQNILGPQIIFGGPSTFFGGPGAAPAAPIIPPLAPFGGPGFDFGGRTPKPSGFGAIGARYIPNLRGLESGRIATRTTGIFTGAETRGITKDLAKALGYNIKTKRRK